MIQCRIPEKSYINLFFCVCHGVWFCFKQHHSEPLLTRVFSICTSHLLIYSNHSFRSSKARKLGHVCHHQILLDLDIVFYSEHQLLQLSCTKRGRCSMFFRDLCSIFIAQHMQALKTEQIQLEFVVFLSRSGIFFCLYENSIFNLPMLVTVTQLLFHRVRP